MARLEYEYDLENLFAPAFESFLAKNMPDTDANQQLWVDITIYDGESHVDTLYLDISTFRDPEDNPAEMEAFFDSGHYGLQIDKGSSEGQIEYGEAAELYEIVAGELDTLIYKRFREE